MNCDKGNIGDSTRVLNGRRKNGLDQLVRSKVKSSLMVEIGPTGQSGLSKPTRPGPVRPGPPGNRICYYYHNMLRSNKDFLNKTYCFHGLYSGDSASLLGVAKIGSQVSNHFWCIK